MAFWKFGRFYKALVNPINISFNSFPRLMFCYFSSCVLYIIDAVIMWNITTINSEFYLFHNIFNVSNCMVDEEKHWTGIHLWLSYTLCDFDSTYNCNFFISFVTNSSTFQGWASYASVRIIIVDDHFNFKCNENLILLFSVILDWKHW